MQVLNDRVQARRRNFEYYQASLGDLPGIAWQPESEGSFSNRWLTCLTLDPTVSGGLTREDLRLELEKDNIESRPLWKPMHLQPVFVDAPFYGDGTSQKLFEQGLCLPSGSNLTQEDLDRVIQRIRSLFGV
jgi:dTDP-4-amino-4,6-dideoxygalactose transaminase